MDYPRCTADFSRILIFRALYGIPQNTQSSGSTLATVERLDCMFREFLSRVQKKIETNWNPLYSCV